MTEKVFYVIKGKKGNSASREPKPQAPRFEDAPDFVARVKRELKHRPADLVKGVIAGVGVGAFYGLPRGQKTHLIYLLMILLALGKSAYGFTIPRRVRVLYVSEEDSPLSVMEWMCAICKGLKVDVEELRGWLWIESCDGLSLETPLDQQRVIDLVKNRRCDLVIFDTLRRLAPNWVDRGPAEVQPLVDFFRALQRAIRKARKREIAIQVSHHVVKPLRGKAKQSAEQEAEPQSLSGGGLDSAIENPTHLKKTREMPDTSLTDGRVKRVAMPLVSPRGWKYSTSPKPFSFTTYSVVRTEEDGTEILDKAWFSRQDGSASTTNIRDEIVQHFNTHPARLSVRGLARALGANRATVGAVVERMVKEKVLDRRGGSQRDRTYGLRSQEEA